MGSAFIDGSSFYFSSTLGSAIAVTGISNADPAVASASSPPMDGDIAIVSSGWARLNETVARVANSTASDFELEGVDTSDTGKYPAGQGAGSVQVASGFFNVNQITDVQVSGGDQDFYTWDYVEDPSGRQRKRPTTKAPIEQKLMLDYDPSLAWHQKLVDLDASKQLCVMKRVLPNGTSTIYSLGYLSFQEVPTGNKHENQKVTATFSMVAPPIRYDS